MGIDEIFKITAIGVIVALLNILLKKSDREEYALVVTIAGLIIVALMIARELSKMFNLIKSLFGF